MRIKVLFSRESNNNMPATIEWAYDENAQLANAVNPGASNLLIYTNYTMLSCPDTYQVSRYIGFGGLKKRLGISYNDATDANLTYYGQLQAATSPSVYLRVTASGGFAVPPQTIIGALSVTYFCKFRGLDFGNNP